MRITAYISLLSVMQDPPENQLQQPVFSPFARAS